MQWNLKQRGWRALLIRTALLTALWLVVAFVFGTEFYLSARGMPVKISWTDAARGAFRDWFPWMLLSPLAVILAGCFRFDLGHWRRSLMVHFAACCLFAIAYEGLLYVAFPAPFLLSTGSFGITSSAGDMPHALPDFSIVQEAASPPPPVFLSASSNSSGFDRGGFFITRAGPLPAPTNSNAMMVVSEEHASFISQPSNVTVGFQGFPTVNRWTQFLYMAMLKTQFTVPIYLCIICICWVINHFQETGERERRTLELETRLTQANLQALKMQLQPHFLFNTLNAISSLVHENPKVADDMIGSLSQFLRTTLDVSSQNEVPLR